MKNWTAAEDAVIRDGYASKRPIRDIAADLGVTRNAVIGRANRLGCWHGETHSEQNAAARAERVRAQNYRRNLTRRMTPAVPASV